MKIIIKEPGKKIISLPIPTRLIFNYAAAVIAPPFMRKHGINVTVRQAFCLINAINRSRHAFPGWKLLEAETKDGQCVEIIP